MPMTTINGIFDCVTPNCITEFKGTVYVGLRNGIACVHATNKVRRVPGLFSSIIIGFASVFPCWRELLVSLSPANWEFWEYLLTFIPAVSYQRYQLNFRSISEN